MNYWILEEQRNKEISSNPNFHHPKSQFIGKTVLLKDKKSGTKGGRLKICSEPLIPISIEFGVLLSLIIGFRIAFIQSLYVLPK